MISLYEGSVRLQLFFETPNQLATALLMLCFFLLGLGSYLLNSRPNAAASRNRFLNLAGVAAIVLALVCIPALLLTYSRGGFVSFVFCAAIALVFKPSRKVAAIAVAVFLLGLAAVPNGAQRAIESLPSAADASVTNRFVVWQRTLALAPSRVFLSHRSAESV